MRTTLDIDEDVLQAAKELAHGRGVSAGKALSDLARKGLMPPLPHLKTRNGFPLLPVRADGGIVTTELVKRLLDEER